MLRRPRGMMLRCLCVVGTFASSLVAQASDASTRQPHALAQAESAVLCGRVLLPDGSPAEGAVVVASAGGQAVTDASGEFSLQLALPADAECVQVTAALGSGSEALLGSVRVGGLVRPGTTRAGTLQLAKSTACQPEWLPTFGMPFGVGSYVSALAVFDDGSGPAIYAGGSFESAGGVPMKYIAKWDGKYWSELGSGLDGSVQVLYVFDDGSGAALYAGGSFTSAGGVPASTIAKWDGASWSALGSGLGGDPYSLVSALTEFDDGSGVALYAGGTFTSAGGVPANAIAKWDGKTWAALGSGLDFPYGAWVSALSVYDDGSGAALYAGGIFETAGGVPAANIARWNGTTWSALGAGIQSGLFFTSVSALQTFDDGSGPALYVGGDFKSAGGIAANNIARWNGSSWSALGSGPTGGTSKSQAGVAELAVFDDGNGPALYAGGYFNAAGGAQAMHVAKWNGTNWSALGTGLGYPWISPDEVTSFAVCDSGSGPALIAGGYFSAAGDVWAENIATWDGTSWSVPSIALDAEPLVLAVYDDGNGPALYVGGVFQHAGGIETSSIAKWDGSAWTALGSGMASASSIDPPSVDALAVFDDGTGPALYAGGSFLSAGGVTANGIAKWDGTSWSAVGGGVPGGIRVLTAFDDGSGPALYAGGGFTTVGGVPASCIAKWDGIAWSELGSGMSDPLFGVPRVNALSVFDDGAGPALYAGGFFLLAGGVTVNHIAKWDGTTWSAVGGGVAGGPYISEIRALMAFDDGSGPGLYAGGLFTIAGDEPANDVARWDGSTWSALGSGVMNDPFYPSVNAFTVFDDGSGSALYAGGAFTTAGGVPASCIAKWDGTAWSALGSGLASGYDPSVGALAVFDDGNGPALFAAGSYYSVFLDSGDNMLGKWGCPAAASPWTDLGHALAGLAGEPTLAGSGSLLPDTKADLLLTGAHPGAAAFFVVSSTASELAFKGGTLVPTPTAVVALLVDAAGQLALEVRVPPDLPSGCSVYMQDWIQDPGGPEGYSASNALLATTP